MYLTKLLFVITLLAFLTSCSEPDTPLQGWLDTCSYDAQTDQFARSILEGSNTESLDGVKITQFGIISAADGVRSWITLDTSIANFKAAHKKYLDTKTTQNNSKRTFEEFVLDDPSGKVPLARI